MNKQKSQSGSIHLIVTVVLALAVVGLLGFVFWQNFIQKNDTTKTDSVTNTSTPKTTPTKTTAVSPYAGWKTYSNFGITVNYPKDWYVTEYNPGGIYLVGSVTFSNQPHNTMSEGAPKGYIEATIGLYEYGFVTGSSQGVLETLSASTGLEHFIKRSNGYTDDDTAVTVQSKQIGNNQAVCLTTSEVKLFSCGVKTSKGVYEYVNYLGGDKSATGDVNNSNLIYESIVLSK